MSLQAVGTRGAPTVAAIMDNIRRLFQVINEQSRRIERETGLTGPQVWVVKTLAEHAPLRVSELAGRMYLHPATVGGILDRLEKRGLILRTRCEDDRRAVEVTLTEAGRHFVLNSPEAATTTIVHGLESLPPGDLGEIRHALDRLVAILGAQNLPPQLIGCPEINLPDDRYQKAE